jgi:hypothetical protein
MSLLFSGKVYAIVYVYVYVGEVLRLCVSLHVYFLVFKAFRINTDVLAAYTLCAFKYWTASRALQNRAVRF